MRLSPPYSRYAEVYDRIGQRTFGERIAEATIEWLSTRGVTPTTVADLACGTGSSALIFARAGAKVVGVDRAPAMLAAATRAAETAELSVDWLEQDLRDLALPAPVELAVCFFDAVNYLVDDGDLECVFRRVHRSLVDGGWFVFDLNTRRRLAEGWGDAFMIAADRDNLFGAYRSWFEPETQRSPLILTFFVRSGDENCWERFDEEHVERAHDLDEVATTLAAVGFDVVDVREHHEAIGKFGGPGSEACDRVVFFARRADGSGKATD